MRLRTVPALSRPDLVAAPVLAALQKWDGAVPVDEVQVAEIDPDLADTGAFCAAYDVPLDVSANCVIVVGRRGGDTRYAASVVLATNRADVNGLVRRYLDVRKCSFAAMDDAVELTGMEYGGITPIGLAQEWPVLIDSGAASAPHVIIGSGVRRSKLWLPGAALEQLPNAAVLAGLGLPA